MENRKSLGEYIAQRRRALGMTQRQFAEKLYVTDSAVSKWERGLSYPDITLLHDICEILDISEHELLTASEDTEARRAETLARRYIRLVCGWKFGQIACYSLAAVVCFIADLASDGALSWFWVVLTSLLTAASLTLTPALAPERMGGVWTAGAFTLAIELLLGVCCLYTGGDWFFVAGMSVLFGLCLLLLPLVLLRLPLPEALVSRKALLCLGADLALLLGLLGVCCAYTDGDWFWITAVSVLFAASILLPFVIRQLPLPEALTRHRAALWLGMVSLMLFVLLGAACLYDGGHWFLLPALPMALYGLLLPWGVLVLVRYLRVGRWFRASAAVGFTALWYWLFPWVLDRVMALDGRFSDQPYSLLRPFGFDLLRWDTAGTASNVMLLILAALILAALILAAVGILRRRK